MRLLVPVLLVVVAASLPAQVRPRPNPSHSNSLIDSRPQTHPSPEAKSLLQRIEKGILDGSAEAFNADLGKQVAMTMSGHESGHYSSGQAFAVIQNYFSARKPTQFSFTRLNDSVPSPYATGRLIFISRGVRESVQVYVSLSRQDNQWVISQFNIY